ncbi:Dynein regulatory complex protein 8 [Schistosoma japonicum]|nr:Dynein regulatory complex protein 8 [Schistosoma japonicum]
MRINEVFDLFDHERNKTIDFRELGTVIRALGGVPTEAEVISLVRELENDPPNGYINYEKFLPVMLQAIEQKRFEPASEEELLRAFLTLDSEKKGFLSSETLESYMISSGEPFTKEEMEEMLAAATDLSKGKIMYRDFVIQLSTFDGDSN